MEYEAEKIQFKSDNLSLELNGYDCNKVVKGIESLKSLDHNKYNVSLRYFYHRE